MHSKRVYGLGLGMLFALAGCGGSNEPSSSVFSHDGDSYIATLSDGAQMDLDIAAEQNGVWEGDFVIGRPSIPDQANLGTFTGVVNGTGITLHCEALDGTKFLLTGTIEGKRLLLAKSDAPSTILDFELQKPRASDSRGEVSFMFDTGYVNEPGGVEMRNRGRVTLPDKPSEIVDGVYKIYKGKWFGIPAHFTECPDGGSRLSIYYQVYSRLGAFFPSYKVQDFSSKTARSSDGIFRLYVPDLTKFRDTTVDGGTMTASPK